MLEKVPLRMLNSWQVGGTAEFFCEPASLDELRTALRWARERATGLTLLSGGSNVLIADDGIDGLTISLKNLRTMNVVSDEANHVLDCAPGLPKADLLKFFLKVKSPAALFLAGIPGDVGGGFVMNAGVSEHISPREFCEIVSEVDVIRPDSQMATLTGEQIQWAYRHSSGWQPGIITRVRIRVPNAEEPDIIRRVRDANLVRLKKQPLDQPSCGSVFRNPPGLKAAVLIDSAGLKGYSQGQAMVSPKHANFIVNVGGATALDIHRVITHVQDRVMRSSGVELKTEVVYLGKWEKDFSQSSRF